MNKSGTRYWLAFDLGLQGDYDDLYSWLDKQKAKECGGNVATFVSTKTRDQIVRELSGILDPKKSYAEGQSARLGDLSGILEPKGRPRIYIISMKQGGKFILGKRTFAPWTGYAQVSLESEEER